MGPTTKFGRKISKPVRSSETPLWVLRVLTLGLPRCSNRSFRPIGQPVRHPFRDSQLSTSDFGLTFVDCSPPKEARCGRSRRGASGVPGLSPGSLASDQPRTYLGFPLLLVINIQSERFDPTVAACHLRGVREVLAPDVPQPARGRGGRRLGAPLVLQVV